VLSLFPSQCARYGKPISSKQKTSNGIVTDRRYRIAARRERPADRGAYELLQLEGHRTAEEGTVAV